MLSAKTRDELRSIVEGGTYEYGSFTSSDGIRKCVEGMKRELSAMELNLEKEQTKDDPRGCNDWTCGEVYINSKRLSADVLLSETGNDSKMTEFFVDQIKKIVDGSEGSKSVARKLFVSLRASASPNKMYELGAEVVETIFSIGRRRNDRRRIQVKSLTRLSSDRCTVYVTALRMGQCDVTVDCDYCIVFDSDIKSTDGSVYTGDSSKNDEIIISDTEKRSRVGINRSSTGKYSDHKKTNLTSSDDGSEDVVWIRTTFKRKLFDESWNRAVNSLWNVTLTVVAHSSKIGAAISSNAATIPTSVAYLSPKTASSVRRRAGKAALKAARSASDEWASDEEANLLGGRRVSSAEKGRRESDLFVSGSKGSSVAERLDMCRLENIAIPVTYFMMGMTLKFPLVALREYMRKVLQVDPDTQTMVLGILATMPWHMKLLFAFLSDSQPIRGQRRKPYIIVGVLTCGLMWLIFGLCSPEPGLALTSVLLFSATFGLVMTDVNLDAVVVERVSEEVNKGVGTLQAVMWRLRYGGAFVGMLLGGILLDQGGLSEQTIFCIVGVLHLLCQLPFILLLGDPTGQKQRNVMGQTRRIFEAVSDRQIYQPLFFLLFSGIMPNNSDAFANFLLGPLEFGDFEYAAIAAVSIVALIGGITIYDKYLKDADIHVLFYVVITIQSLLKLTQLILVFRINQGWGISDFWFSFGDEVINDVFNFMLQMPILIYAARVCPKDVEGSVYAFLTMAMNVSGSAGNTVSSFITEGLGITLTNFDNLWVLTVLCALCNMIPMVLVTYLPRFISDVKRITSKSPKNAFLGKCVLGTVLLFFLWSLASAVVNVALNHSHADDPSAAADIPDMIGTGANDTTPAIIGNMKHAYPHHAFDDAREHHPYHTHSTEERPG